MLHSRACSHPRAFYGAVIKSKAKPSGTPSGTKEALLRTANVTQWANPLALPADQRACAASPLQSDVCHSVQRPFFFQNLVLKMFFLLLKAIGDAVNLLSSSAGAAARNLRYYLIPVVALRPPRGVRAEQ